MTYLTETMRTKLASLFEAAGAHVIELPILYHADLFLDLIGEDIRRRLYIAPGGNGEAMALRPEFTIPSCLHHLKNGEASEAACYGYVGPVFRKRSDGQIGEFHQAGIELIDPVGGPAFDAKSVALANEAVSALSDKAPKITLGDRALFSALLTALEAPSVWQRRLEGAFGDRVVLERMLDRLATGASESHGASVGLARILDGKANEDVRDAVEEMLDIAGLSAVGGRSVGDIAERYMEKAELAAKAGWDSEKLSILRRYLDISGSLDAACEALRDFDRETGNCLGDALAKFLDRAEAVRNALPAGQTTYFQADFGRRLDYYSGFNFELHLDGAKKPVAGGGRYDSLLGLVSPKAERGNEGHKAVPAIGFAIWLDRLDGSDA